MCVSLQFPDKCWDICTTTLLPNMETLHSGGLFAVKVLDVPLIFQHAPMLLSDEASAFPLQRFGVLGFLHQHSGSKHLH